MLNVLLESKAVRTRRTGGTIASTLLHGALFAGAVTVTTRTLPPKPPVVEEVHPVYRPPPIERTSHEPRRATQPSNGSPTQRLSIVDRILDHLPPIVEATIPVASNEEVAHDVTGTVGQLPGGVLGGPSGPPDGVLDSREVDRAPRLLVSPVRPTFPTMLRERGVGGRVLVQFVVDTTGRAEMSGLRIVEANDSLFAQSVRMVLPRYRFSPGEVGGQKVRTLVQMPFDFTVLR